MNKKCVFKFFSNSCEVQSSFWRNISQDYYCLRGYITIAYEAIYYNSICCVI